MSTLHRPEFYLRQAQGQLPRLLGLYDLDPESATFGLGDRDHWGWKLKDYNNAALQGGVCAISLLIASGKLDASHANLKIVDAILTASARLLHGNGGVDEAYPYESSWCGTATLAFQFARSLEVLGDRIPNAARHRETLQRMARFLADHRETHGIISNHLATGAAALGLVAGFEAASQWIVDEILRHQSPDGWFREYDGADPGYQTLCTYYLAEILLRKPDPKLEQAIGKSLEFLSYCVHPDGTLGGEYGSRNTEVYYPAGLELLAPRFPLAASIADRMARSLSEGRSVPLASADAGNFVVLFESYARAATAPGTTSTAPLPCDEAAAHRHFPDAGIVFHATDRLYTVINARKGGVCKVFDRRDGRLLLDDGGFVGSLDDGSRVSTQMIHADGAVTVDASKVELRAPFFVMLHRQMTPWTLTALRMLNLTWMRIPPIGRWIKGRMVAALVTDRRTVGARVERTFTFEPGAVVIRNRVVLENGTRFRALSWGRKFSAIHMASAKYPHAHTWSALGSPPREVAVDALNRDRTVELQARVPE
jgi:hypothetical protein